MIGSGKTILSILLVGASALIAPTVSFAQSDGLPACRSSGSDADGDGFGFEPTFGSYQSCLVTADSLGVPQIANAQTQRPVNLVRAYWNANRDIADRAITCEVNRFDSEQNQYARERTLRYSHDRLPNSAPFTADMAVLNSLPPARAQVWTVIDGQYVGDMFFGFWFEGITRNGTAAVRAWSSETRYTECYDESGAAFGPTGFPQEVLPVDNSTPTDWTVTFGPDQQAPARVVNLETGQAVQLQRAFWSLRDDILDKVIACRTYDWFENGSMYVRQPEPTVYYYHPIASNSSASGTVSATFDSSSSPASVGSWALEGDNFIVDNGIGYPFQSYVEQVGSSVRAWTSNESYSECVDAGSVSAADSFNERTRGLFPTGQMASDDTNTAGGACIDTDGDGFGWNGVATCNPASSTTQAPVVTEPQASQCIDTDGDGFGWDGTATCIPTGSAPSNMAGTVSGCDYTDADLFSGWGWNAATSQSCPPLSSGTVIQPSAPQCIDTDGDGFGWDGSATCIP